jgi:hypothetical protein
MQLTEQILQQLLLTYSIRFIGDWERDYALEEVDQHIKISLLVLVTLGDIESLTKIMI